MMEKLGEPQTHLQLKSMIKEVDEDKDGQISFREATPIENINLINVIDFSPSLCWFFKKPSRANWSAKVWPRLPTSVTSRRKVSRGAKSFFEAKVAEQSKGAKFEQEIKAEQEKKQKEAEEQKARRAAFKEKASWFH